MNPASPQPFALRPEQVRFFDAFGFLKLPGLFREEIGHITECFEALMERRAADVTDFIHDAHYDNPRKLLFNFIDSDPYLANMMADPRILGIARALVGPDFTYISSDGNVFTGDTVWHTDSYNLIRRHRFIKIAFYLDRMTVDCGGLRIVPGSQHEGDNFAKTLHQLLPTPEKTLGLSARQIPCHIVEIEPGDVVIFNYRVQHATCDTRHPRRMFHYGAARHIPEPLHGEGIRMVREIIQRCGQLYAEPLASHPHPAIQSALSQLKSFAQVIREETSQPEGNA